MSHINRTHRITSIVQLLAACQKHPAKIGGLLFNSKPLELEEITTCLQAVIATAQGVADARAVLDGALHEEGVAIEQAAPVMKVIKAFVANAYPNQPELLADFGLRKRSRKERTVEEKLETVKRNRATRTARNTMGRKQKARADFHEPAFRADLLGVVELSAVA